LLFRKDEISPADNNTLHDLIEIPVTRKDGNGNLGIAERKNQRASIDGVIEYATDGTTANQLLFNV